MPSIQETLPSAAGELQVRRILVTGGSKGIGTAIVAKVAALGATVVATARSAPDTLPDRVNFATAG